MILSARIAGIAIVLAVLEPAAFGQDGHGPVRVVELIKLGATPPLRTMRPLPPQAGPKREKPLLPIPDADSPAQGDPVVQTSAGPLVGTTPGLNFDGVGNGSYGFAPDAAPPDTNGAAGLTQYVQWVNESFAVFDKTTRALLYGPAAGNTLWSGTGSICEITNDGDPIVRYDGMANRWVLTQLSYSLAYYFGYWSCIAVSQTSDATGAYYLYALQFSNLDDYPKLAVWPDAYYMTFNMFQPKIFSYSYVGPQVWALERDQMLSGGPARALGFQLGSSYSSLLPADLDGSGQAPPSGAPNYILGLGRNAVRLWKFHVDWNTTSNTTLTGPTNIAVASFSKACGGGTCIPQKDTTQQLDSLGDRLMYRVGYRNFGDHESLVANHSVAVGGGKRGNNGVAGIRWYEIRNPSGAPFVYQQGTFSPDSTHRWMGSIAMDQAGNILVGYSASSSSLYPAIRFTGRVPTDLLGTLQAESSIIEGGGSQLPTLSRWGDYSAMSVDPDGCTFWYTNP